MSDLTSEIMDSEIHTNLDSVYNIGREIGRGSYGVVYQISTKEEKINYAAKYVRNYVGTTFEGIYELNSMSIIQHPSIIKYISFYLTDNGIIYVLPYAKYDLYTLIREYEVNEDEKIQFFYEILSAVDFLHRNGMYHCDIKPDNILIIDGKCVLSDLGLSGYLERRSICQTQHYASPEALAILHDDIKMTGLLRRAGLGYGTKLNFKKIDIWAVGAVFGFILSGHHLFFTDRGSVPPNLMAYIDKPFQYLLARGIPEGYVPFITSILEPDVNLRFDSAKKIFKDPLFTMYEKLIPGIMDYEEINDINLSDDTDIGVENMDEVTGILSDILELSVKADTSLKVYFNIINIVYRCLQFIIDNQPETTITMFFLATYTLVIELLGEYSNEYKKMYLRSGIKFDKLDKLRKDILNECRGTIINDQLYDNAFSLWSVRKCLRLTLNPKEYIDYDFKRFIFTLYEDEPAEERQNRQPKNVKLAVLYSGKEKDTEK
jgi:serine/threonine protein kinase